jgi:hypothetical protein
MRVQFGSVIDSLNLKGEEMSDSDKIVVETEQDETVVVSPEDITVEPVDPDEVPTPDDASDGEDNEESEEVVPPDDNA